MMQGPSLKHKSVNDLLLEEVGNREFHCKWIRFVFVTVCLLWAVFQLWYASPFPFEWGIGAIDDTKARAIHLSFAMFLAFLAFPFNKRNDTQHHVYLDVGLAVVAASCSAYLFVFYTDIALRSGAPTMLDVCFSVVGIAFLLEATRRALGPPLMVVAGVFLIYTFLGPFMPEVIAHKGASLNKVVSQFWLTTEGVFGVALGVSTSFVFLFVLFGALLEKAGAGNYFVQVSFSLLGHLRGGPAKAAVVSSGLSGIISGSSIANVVTTGTFTIPLMKRVGFPAHKAGAVEVAASTNGQLTPPIMGAAAFLMVEYVGISYLEVIKHALLPALISYVALIYIVHLEACKMGMEGIKRPQEGTFFQRLFSLVSTFVGFLLLSAIVYYGFGWTKEAFGHAASIIAAVFMGAAYVGLVWYASRFPKLEHDDLEKELTELPPVGPTVKAGLFFLLPVFVLIWCLMVERFSPGLSAFWATSYMMFIVVTHKAIDAFFREGQYSSRAVKEGFSDLFGGLITGSRNMIGIGVATAAAGIVVGTVTLTGLGFKMTEFVEFISGGNLLLMLFFTAGISLVLGLGLPTTANYIVVSTLMAPVIVTLGAEHGLVVPLIAVHLFVFYFGILADDTPPVGLAAFAASAIAKSNPIKTGIQGFKYDIRTAILPFMFIFNTQLLLIDIDNVWELAVTVLGALVAMLAFASATQRWWLTKVKLWESLTLILVAFVLFRPGFFWDEVFPPFKAVEPTAIYEVVEQIPENGFLRLSLDGVDINGDMNRKVVVLPLGEILEPSQRLQSTGLRITMLDTGRAVVDSVAFSSAAEKMGIQSGWVVSSVQVENERPPKQWMFLPAICLLILVYGCQRKRYVQEQSAT